MSVNGINSNYSTQTADAYTNAGKAAETAGKAADTSNQSGSGVVYEKSSQSAKSPKTYSNLVSQMKMDAQNHASQLQSLVEKLITKQGNTYNSIWNALSSGDLQVDAETRLQAQKDIAEDGYWGVEQTSDRILSFAKALSQDDPSKADEMIKAFQKGYQQATGAWGKDLPSISGQTYDAVMEKFEAWKSEAQGTTA